jgi:hypothetical protein
MARNQRHVTRHPDGGWQVRKPGATKASARVDSQRQGIGRARTILSNDGGGELIIHRPNGRIRDANTVPPGHDPNPPRDKR